MHVRDAVEDDAAALAARANLPADAVYQLIHDRTVCVVEPDDGHGDAGGGDEQRVGRRTDRSDIRGFLAFDADEGAVHVTQVAGDHEAVAMLLEEPIRFAEHEGMPVEVLVSDSETTVREVVEDAGFREVDSGPRFAGESISRYRLTT